MMKKTILTLLVLGIYIVSSLANDQTLIKIHDREISKDEFLRIYNKNNNNNTIDNKTIEEYLELFVNFKLKVIEAEEQGYDTMPSFKSEFEEYRSQLVKPYFIDKEAEEKLIKEAYNRMSNEINASHILIRVGEKASPEDTASAYRKAIEIRNRIINGEDFAEVAKATSDDESAKTNDGNLGYFTAFSMVYPFECAAYSTPLGEISMPVRSQFGYHIVKVLEKRPARGRIKAAHIMKAIPRDADNALRDSMKNEIFKIYELLKSGSDFAELAKEHSSDKQSGKDGGELPWFSSIERRVPSSFIDQCFAIKNTGEYSEPFQTDFGWHIVKKISVEGIKSFEDSKEDLSEKVKRDPRRSMISEKTAVEKLKDEYQFKQDLSKLNYVANVLSDDVFKAAWKADVCTNNEVIFYLDGKEFTQQDLASYIESTQSEGSPYNLSIYVDEKYAEFVEKSVLEYEESQLDEKYPEYKYLVQEYHDGILLFNLTDEMVWSKAVKDTTGLRAFHEQNKDNYTWGVRSQVTVYSSDDAKKMKALVKVLKKNDVKNAEAVEMVCDTANSKCITYERGLFEKGDNEIVDLASWEVGISKPIKKDDKIYIVQVKEILPETPKEFSDAAGLITSDYQNYLDQKWISELREKYQIEIDKELLSTIK